ncbi:hypothetical protein BLNAU_6389 [Blattamonas nauphoetae]|uniref:Uncharacterized protein n=1 Tax=Blattamonas nauphoetae TaxID=2049346 RepID=A0ABQ9Y4F8_9EUKA|nr:hypothetical protein BLNAU_6389 [Blattamonas nauphoetae]
MFSRKLPNREKIERTRNLTSITVVVKDLALVLHYEITLSHINKQNKLTKQQIKTVQERVFVHELTEKSNIKSIAAKIVADNKDITKADKYALLVEKLKELQHSLRDERLKLEDKVLSLSGQESSNLLSQIASSPQPPSIERLSKYIDNLYDPDSEKVLTAAASIFILSKDKKNHHALLSSRSLTAIFLRLITQNVNGDLRLPSISILILLNLSPSSTDLLINEEAVIILLKRVSDENRQLRADKCRSGPKFRSFVVFAQSVIQILTILVSSTQESDEELNPDISSNFVRLSQELLETDDPQVILRTLQLLDLLAGDEEMKDEMIGSNIEQTLQHVLQHASIPLVMSSALNLLSELCRSPSFLENVVSNNQLMGIFGIILKNIVEDQNTAQATPTKQVLLTALVNLLVILIDEEHCGKVCSACPALANGLMSLIFLPSTSELLTPSTTLHLQGIFAVIAQNSATLPILRSAMSAEKNQSFLMSLAKKAVQTESLFFIRLLEQLATTSESDFSADFDEVLPFLIDFAKKKAKPNSPILLALLSVLSHSSSFIDLSGTAHSCDLLGFLSTLVNQLMTTHPENEELLIAEIVKLIGRLSEDEDMMPLIHDKGWVEKLNQILNAYYSNEQIFTDCLITFYNFLISPETFPDIIESPETLIGFFLSVLYDGATNRIRRIAHKALAEFMDADPELQEIIKMRRFELYNQDWVDHVQGQGLISD